MFFNGSLESLKFQSVLDLLPGVDDFCSVETSKPALGGGSCLLSLVSGLRGKRERSVRRPVANPEMSSSLRIFRRCWDIYVRTWGQKFLSCFELQFYTCLNEEGLRESFHFRLDTWTSKKKRSAMVGVNFKTSMIYSQNSRGECSGCCFGFGMKSFISVLGGA